LIELELTKRETSFESLILLSHLVVFNSGIITWRGILTKILVAPYEDRDGWE